MISSDVPKTPQYYLNINGTPWNIVAAFAASNQVRHFRRSGAMATWLNRTVGALFICFGDRLAIGRA